VIPQCIAGWLTAADLDEVSAEVGDAAGGCPRRKRVEGSFPRLWRREGLEGIQVYSLSGLRGIKSCI